MRSGVKNYSSVPAFSDAFSVDPGRQWTPAELVALAIPRSPVFEPGMQYDYSNTNTVLLGMVVERGTGRPLVRAYRALILRPLSLAHTAYPQSFRRARPIPTP